MPKEKGYAEMITSLTGVPGCTTEYFPSPCDLTAPPSTPLHNIGCHMPSAELASDGDGSVVDHRANSVTWWSFLAKPLTIEMVRTIRVWLKTTIAIA
jgi:hypothetical protein